MMNYFKNLFHKMQNEMKVKSDDDWGREEVKTENQKGDINDLYQISRDQQIDLRLQGRGGLYLKKIDEAMERIKQGTFGECKECGCDIGLERLKARPTATLCINCKEEQEREESFVPYQKRSHTLGKSLSVVGNNVLEFPGDDNNRQDVSAKILEFGRENES